MPTIIEIERYRVMVFTRDEHPPAHVHVWKDGCIMKIVLHKDAVEYHSYEGVKPKPQQQKRAEEIVSEYLDICRQAWEHYHE